MSYQSMPFEDYCNDYRDDYGEEKTVFNIKDYYEDLENDEIGEDDLPEDTPTHLYLIRLGKVGYYRDEMEIHDNDIGNDYDVCVYHWSTSPFTGLREYGIYDPWC